MKFRKMILLGLSIGMVTAGVMTSSAADCSMIGTVQRANICGVDVDLQRIAFQNENEADKICIYDYMGDLVYTFDGPGRKDDSAEVLERRNVYEQYIIDEVAVSSVDTRVDFYDFAGNYIRSEVMPAKDALEKFSYNVQNASTDFFVESNESGNALVLYNDATGKSSGVIPMESPDDWDGFVKGSFLFLENMGETGGKTETRIYKIN